MPRARHALLADAVYWSLDQEVEVRVLGEARVLVFPEVCRMIREIGNQMRTSKGAPR